MGMPQFMKDKLPKESAPDTIPGNSDDGAVGRGTDDAEIAGVLEDAETETTETESGPDEESGELLQDEVDEDAADADSTEDEQTEEAPEEGQEQGQKDEAPAKGSVDSRDVLIQEQGKQIALLMSLVDPKALQQAQPAPLPPARPKPPLSVVKAALFGGMPKDQWEKLPAEQRAQAEEVAQRHVEDESRFALDPSLRYQEQIQREVITDVLKLIRPILDDFHVKEARSKVDEPLKAVRDPNVRQRALDLYNRNPGSRSGEWRERGQAMELAIMAAEGESLKRQAAERKQQKVAGRVQKAASGGGTLKAAPKNGGAPQGEGIPDMKANESVVDYYARVEKILSNNKNNKK